jgi:hypothetical protein
MKQAARPLWRLFGPCPFTSESRPSDAGAPQRGARIAGMSGHVSESRPDPDGRAARGTARGGRAAARESSPHVGVASTSRSGGVRHAPRARLGAGRGPVPFHWGHAMGRWVDAMTDRAAVVSASPAEPAGFVPVDGAAP